MPIGFDGSGRHVSQVAVELAFERDNGEIGFDPAADLVDETKDALLACPFGLLREQDLAGMRVFEAGRDADRIARFRKASAENGAHGRALRELFDGLRRHRSAVKAAHLVEDLIEAVGAKNLELGRLREIRHQHVGESHSQPLELWIAGQILEMQHCERWCLTRWRGVGWR